MDVLSAPSVDDVSGRPAAGRLHTSIPPCPQAELAQLRAQIATLQAERAALWWAVGHDELTGLPNRRLLYTMAPPLLADPARAAVVVVLDLNGFKPINDTFGHAIGDEVLRIVASRMATCVSATDLVARLGGDEFAVVLTGPRPRDESPWWQAPVTRLASEIAAPMAIRGRRMAVTASIGVAAACGGANLADLIRFADMAMYQAKVTGHTHIAIGPGQQPCPADAIERQARALRTTAGRRPRAGQPAGPTGPAPDAWPVPQAWQVPQHWPVALPGPGQPAPDGDPEPRIVELTLSGSADAIPNPGTAPTCCPETREPDEVVPAHAYRPGDQVWVFRHGAWRPGVVESASARAILATYRCAQGMGTVVDTMLAMDVAWRHGPLVEAVEPTSTPAPRAATRQDGVAA